MAGFPSNAPNRLSGDFSLSDREVHVWTLNIGGDRRPWEYVLSRDELDAASRMTGERTLRFKNSRAALRLILGNYLPDSPASLQFTMGPHGKPYVSAKAINFNISHSGDMLAVAVARSFEIGVDIEEVRKIDDLHAVAAQFFTPWEIKRLSQVEPSAIDRTFLKMWVRKEATLKAAGTGLSDGLSASVPFQENIQGEVAHLESRSGRSPFYLYDLVEDSEFVGAIATCRREAVIVRKTLIDRS